MSERQTEKGQHQAENESHKRQLQARVKLVTEAAHRHTLRGYDGDLDEAQIADFVERIRKLSRHKDRELERIKKATSDELRQTQAVLTDLESRRSARIQTRVTAKQIITANEKKSALKQQDLDSVNIDEGRMTVLESSHSDLRNRFRDVTAAYEAAAWDKNIQVENNRLLEQEAESERLRTELVHSNRLAKDRAQLEFIKKEVKDRQRSLDTMISTHSGQINSVIGRDWRIDTLEREFQSVLEQSARAVEDAKHQQEGTSRKLYLTLSSLTKSLSAPWRTTFRS